jgi:hypothetical protein
MLGILELDLVFLYLFFYFKYYNGSVFNILFINNDIFGLSYIIYDLVNALII